MAEQKGQEPIKKVEVAAQQAARAESEPEPVRRYRALLFRGGLFLTVIAFGVLTFLVKTTPAFAIDLQITKAIQSLNFPLFGTFMSLVSWFGFVPQSMVIAGLLIILIIGFGLHWEAVITLISVVLSTTINLLVKNLVQRPRPAPGQITVFDTLNSYSFPSGHVMFYIGLFGFLGFLAFSLLKPSFKRGLLLVIFGSLVALIGVSRIYLGEHWASDVLGSYLLGSLLLVATIQIYVWGKTRFFVHQPVAADAAQHKK